MADRVAARGKEMGTRFVSLRFVATVLLIAVALLVSRDAFGEGFCKWTDENGVVHYAEKCPENSEAERVEIQPPPSEESLREARRRSEALQSALEAGAQARQEQASDRTSARSAQADRRESRRERCINAMVDLHNLLEGEAVYFDEEGRIHDQFSIHSSSYTGERTYIDDAGHEALIADRRQTAREDCDPSREELIERIKMLAQRSDSQVCRNVYQRFLKDGPFGRSESIEELRSTEQTVLEICN